MEIKHVLSVREPFAHLLVSGIKSIENRSMPFPAKLPRPCWVAIHASLSDEAFDDTDMLTDLCEDFPEIDEAWNAPVMVDKDDPSITLRIFGRSEIIGAVEILGSVPYGDDQFAMDQAEVFAGFPERNYGEWANGEHCWVIGRAIRFARPIVCLGALGVRQLTPELVKLVAQQATDTIDHKAPYGKPIVHQLPKVPKRQLAIYQL